MIEGTPKTKAPTMVAAVITPTRTLRACRAYTRLVTLTRAGAGSAGTSMFSDIRVAASAHHGDSGSLRASMKSTVFRLFFVCQLIFGFFDSGLNPRGKALKGLPHHYERVNREGALTARKHHHWIQIQFRDVVAQVVGKP